VDTGRMKESQISREIQAFLRDTIGCAVYSTEQGYRKERGGTRTSPGIPDLIVIHPDAWTFAELKTPKGKLTVHQEGFRLVCEDAGVNWQLWRDVRDAWDWAVREGLILEVE
jgi:hypothetical protein